MHNLRDKIKATNDLKKKEVHVEEWDCTFFLRELTAKERISIEFMLAEESNEKKHLIGPMAICYSAVDKNGNAIFDAGDFSWMAEKNGKVVERLFTEIFITVTEETINDTVKN